MALDFIYVVIIFLLLVLVLAIFFKDYPLGMLASIALMVCGIYIAINGVGNYSSVFTESFGAILIGIGAYVFIGGTLEYMEQF